MRRNLWHHNAHVASVSRQYCKHDSPNDKLKHAVYSHKSGNYHLRKITPMHSLFPMKNMKQKQHILHFVHSCICLYTFFIFVELSSLYCRDFIYYYWCLLSSWNCWKPSLNRVYTNCKMLWSQGPHNGACGIRLHGLFETLSVVFVSDTDCFGVAPARTPNYIEHMNQIEVISFECVRTKSKLNRSEGFWQEKQILCDHKNALPLMSLCLVTLGCWNCWWQLTLTE